MPPGLHTMGTSNSTLLSPPTSWSNPGRGVGVAVGVGVGVGVSVGVAVGVGVSVGVGVGVGVSVGVGVGMGVSVGAAGATDLTISNNDFIAEDGDGSIEATPFLPGKTGGIDFFANLDGKVLRQEKTPELQEQHLYLMVI